MEDAEAGANDGFVVNAIGHADARLDVRQIEVIGAAGLAILAGIQQRAAGKLGGCRRISRRAGGINAPTRQHVVAHRTLRVKVKAGHHAVM